MSQFNLLAIDDDDLVLQSIRMAIEGQWRLTGVNSLADVPVSKFHAAFVDIHLTGNLKIEEGVEAIKALRQKDPHLEIVAMSGDLNRNLMEKCLKAGASRFLAKPLNLDELQLTLGKVEALLLLHEASSRSQLKTQPLIGNSSQINDIKKQVAALKGEHGPILIEGESGAGKEILANLLHNQEGERPFISVNIAAISESLFESEFFGHVNGAFTGADQNKMGLAEAAHGGDLFLDEIEALSPPMQVKLLRFLDSGEVRRVGSHESITVDTRVLVATNRDLDEMVKNEAFREDLLWRIRGKSIHLPPLRERADDVKTLAEYFLSHDSVRKKQLTPEATSCLKAHNWPGNVRELKRICEQLLVQSPLPLIRPEDVTALIAPSNFTASTKSLDFSIGLAELIKDFEKATIKACLLKYKDVDPACELLKISRSSLYKKVKDYQIDWKV